jgi:hypothetical protein
MVRTYIEYQPAKKRFYSENGKGTSRHNEKVAQIILTLQPRKPPKELTSYRPINLLPTVSKVFEKFLLKRILPMVEMKD